MTVIILYTLLLLFTDKAGAGAQCLKALEQWYETMIPALFPMMLLSAIMVDTGLAETLGLILNRSLLRFLHISDSACYCLMTGFLFGFPMGAKTTSDMLMKKSISPKEGEYLMTFINCIGPMYTISFLHGRFPEHALWKLLMGIYGLSFLYGILLRYTLYRRESFKNDSLKASNHAPDKQASFIDAMYECVPKCGKSMLLLGGYMVLFQVSFLTLEHFLVSINMKTAIFHPLLEITGGLSKLPINTPLGQILFYVHIGGACCFLQTYYFLKPAGLSVKKYALHRILTACLAYLISALI